ncbi:MAG: tRNA (guanosine(46)-N7)-methyltransferase TrmB, partial [Spirochaetota bacterium]
MGQATWRLAASMPERNFLGVEVHRPGVGRLLADLLANDIQNVRIVNHDAIEVLETGLEAESLSAIHLFYPDPWPKKRHQKRRIVRPGLVELMVSRLGPGAYIYFVTDIEDYANATLALLTATKGLRNRYDGFASPQEWRPETKFESRAKLAGRSCLELLFERVQEAD